MYLSSITASPVAPGEARPGHGDETIRLIVDQFTALSNAMEDRFRRIAETLATSIDAIDAMAEGLNALQRALSPEIAGVAVARLRETASRLANLPATQRDRAEEIAVLRVRIRELRDLLDEMHEILRLLGFYGMNIKIAAPGEPAFFDFAQSMDGRLEDGRQEIKQFKDRLDRFHALIEDLCRIDGELLAEHTRMGSAIPTEISGNADLLERHLQAVAQMSEDVSQIMRSIQAEVARLLGAIQVADSARQRIEHCAAILRLLIPADGTAPEPAARACLLQLTAAHSLAIAEDFSRDIAAMVVAMERLCPQTDKLVSLIDAHGGDGAENRVLLDMEHSIADIGDVTGRLCETDRQLLTLTAFVVRIVSDLMQGLNRMRRISLDVQDISINMRVLCHRYGSLGRAVAVIAREANPCALRLNDLNTHFVELVEALGGAEFSLSADEEAEDVGGSLDNALAIVRGACERSDQAIERGGEDARRIVQSIERSARDLEGEGDVASTLETAARALLSTISAEEAIGDEDESALRPILEQVTALYTMAREREIHAAHLPPGMADTGHANTPLDEDEDDDGLF